MSTLKPTRKVSRRHELREDTVVTFYARALDVMENQRNVVYGALGVIALVVVFILGMGWYTSNQNDKALAEMAFAVSRYEAGAFQASLDGDITFTGLLDIADSYGSTPSGNLARFYAADALYRVGDMDRALEYFRDYDKSGDYLGASAYAGEAAILEAKGEYSKAGDLYMRAATVFSSEISSPQYLMDAARAFEAAGENDKALRAYRTVESDYEEVAQARNIAFHIAQNTASN